MQISKRTGLRALLAVIIVYLAAYGLLSSLGSYSSLPYSSGRYVNYLGMEIKDCRIWMPLFIKYDKYDNNNFLGVAFAPMVIADRSIWHPPKMLSTPTEEATLIQEGAWFNKPQKDTKP
jgi:hypothetical protein